MTDIELFKERYVIDNVIEFLPHEKKLTNIHTKQSVILHATAALCLLLLLRSKGELVTQKELWLFAWGEKHHRVTQNAFYQCILNLRRAFILLSFEDPVIVTVPRKGILISKDIISFCINDEGEEDEDNSIVSYNTLPSAPALAIHGSPTHNYFFYTLAAILLSFIFVTLLMKKKPGYYDDYILDDAHTGKCQIYVNADARGYTRHSVVIDKYAAECSSDRYIYITAFRNMKNVSLLVCNKKVTESKNSCTSYYFPELATK